MLRGIKRNPKKQSRPIKKGDMLYTIFGTDSDGKNSYGSVEGQKIIHSDQDWVREILNDSNKILDSQKDKPDGYYQMFTLKVVGLERRNV